MNFEDDLYKEETRCEFLVTAKRKRLWAIQLSMLDKFKSICVKHNLKYFAIGGTLLGTVRHNGYIPWDDDIDVGMPRDDFERFMLIVKSELECDEQLIIQYTTFDPNYSTPHARITNIMTTAYFPFVKRADVDVPQGIFIDIFAFDNVPNSKGKKAIHKFIYKSVSYMLHDKQNKFMLEKPSISAKILSACSRMLFLFTDVNEVFKWTQKYIQKYNSDSSCQCFSCIASFYNMNRLIVRREWFDELIELPFEDTTISCPKKYDEVLTCNYGNWNKMVKGGCLHEGCFYDPDRPYTFYKDKNLEDFSNDL